MAFLYQRLAARRRRFTYRFVFIPETIGAVAYLARHGEHLRRHVVAGYTILGLGMPGYVSYKRSRRGDSPADQMAEHVLRNRGLAHKVVDFHPLEGDERQYCSPGFNLPVGSIRRREPGQFPQYHTSLDDKSLVSFDALAESIDIIDEILQGLEADERFISECPYGEPMLGKRGLYRSLGSQKVTEEDTRRVFYLLNYADGRHSLREIADKMGCRVLDLVPISERLVGAGLIRRAKEDETL
jgi:aminopeptidase-like protein